MSQILTEKWKISGTMTAKTGQRIRRSIEVFAEDRGDARKTAREIWSMNGNRNAILNSSIQIKQ